MNSETQPPSPAVPIEEESCDTLTGKLGSRPLGEGLGAAGVAATGAALGAAAGPVGTLVGLVGGSIAGGLTGDSIAESVDPRAKDIYGREN